jgi:tRNA A37 methylthiotransferase MiaB
MILMSAGLRKVIDPVKADVVIMNTCSVRQKWEDRVFGFMREISRYHKEHTTGLAPLFGITGCMVRKSGLAKRYLVNEQWIMNNEQYKRHGTKKIELLSGIDSLMNYDDELFLRSPLIDFVFRIEEVSYLTKILSLITGDDIGNDAKFNEYLQVKQLQENPASANVIIQTGCDNFCTFCIVPHTRGRELSRPQEDIVAEIRDVIATWAKEVTLLGQNVNSYGKETKKKLWDENALTWKKKQLHIAIDIDDTLLSVWEDEIFEVYNKKYNTNLTLHDLKSHNFNDDQNLREIFFDIYYKNFDLHDFYVDAKESLIEFKNQWHRLSLLTSRPDRDKEPTRMRFLKEFGEGFFENMLFTCDYWVDDKSLVAQHFDFDIVIDDAEHHILNYQKNTDTKILIFSQPWNERISENDRMTKVKNWNDIKIILQSASTWLQEVTPFRELLEDINSVNGLDRIRFTSSNPHDMTRDILDAHFELPQMCPYLHFALQSGSDTMLKKMNRKHTYADFKAQLDYLRSHDPLFSISTDIIVGFPGETEEEFQATATAMRECQFDFAFIARYSPRSGTIATDKYEDDISPSEKARRWNILNDILRESVHARNALMIGREEEILISWEGKDETWTGRTRNWKEVLIPKTSDIKVGDLVKVKITESEGWVLIGERV